MHRFSKYHARKITVDGIAFDSKREAQRYTELKILERSGRISELKRQVKFVLIPTQRESSTGFYKKGKHKGEPKPGKILESECAYIADFVYYIGGEMIVEDAKGMRTRDYVIKRKLMLYQHGIKIKEV